MQGGAVGGSSATGTDSQSQSGPPPQQARAGLRLVLASSSGQAMRVCRALFVRAPLQGGAVGGSWPPGTADAALTSLSGPPPRQARSGTRWCRHHHPSMRCVCRARFVRAPLQGCTFDSSSPTGTAFALPSQSVTPSPPQQARSGTRWCLHQGMCVCAGAVLPISNDDFAIFE